MWNLPLCALTKDNLLDKAARLYNIYMNQSRLLVLRARTHHPSDHSLHINLAIMSFRSNYFDPVKPRRHKSAADFFWSLLVAVNLLGIAFLLSRIFLEGVFLLPYFLVSTHSYNGVTSYLQAH